MDARLTSEQQQLRDAAAKLADDLGPGSVAELDDDGRIARLEKTVVSTGWRSLRSDEASGVEVAVVAEEFGRGLVDVPFLGPVLADDLSRHVGVTEPATVAASAVAPDARGYDRAVMLDGSDVLAAAIESTSSSVDLTRDEGAVSAGEAVGRLTDEQRTRWYALALAVTTADIVGAARGAQALACEYAKIREQYGHAIGSYQAVAHLLAESQALIEGSVSVSRHAAWAVDELPSAEAVAAARVAKIYCVRAARTICETAIQVHGGIGNTWECLAHVYLRRVLVSSELWPVSLREVQIGLS